MAKINKPSARMSSTRKTHEGGAVYNITREQELTRSVLACLLWENTFYESGQDIADRITSLVHECKPQFVSDLAIKARTEYKLRHVPLLLACGLAKKGDVGRLLGDTVYQIIQRPDELTELLAIYWKDGKKPLPAQFKHGLARAFRKFNGYQLAKYNRDGVVKLRDVLFLTHAKPQDPAQEAVWKKLIDGTLETPDTWETNLSAGADKKETFERLLTEKKLGYMALLRNLRNMREVGADTDLVFTALTSGAKNSKALPFRYIAAARAVPQWEPQIDEAMQLALEGQEKLTGKTILMVDHSQSMTWLLSTKSDLNRFDAACALAILVRGICDDLRVFAFSSGHQLLSEVAPRKGMALADAVRTSMNFRGTELARAVSVINQEDYDRLIVITDEQTQGVVPGPKAKGYMLNVASYQNGVGYGPWTNITGFSEAVIDYIRELEAVNLQ